MPLSGLETGFSLVEMAIFGFMGMNMLLSGAFILSRGVKRLSTAK